MNKKYIAYSFVALLAVTLVSAGLVNYLSNKAEVSVTVMSPFSFEVSADGNTWLGLNEPATLSLDSIHGGESIHLFARDTNLASVDTVGDSSKIITCDTGLNCSDFLSVEAQTIIRVNGDIKSTSPVYPILSLCTELDANTIAFNYGAPGNAMLVGQDDTTEITAIFQPAALGDYVFTLQKLA